MNVYQISENILSPYCRGKFDENSGKFVTANSLEVINCCKNLCKNWIEYCRNTCKQLNNEDCFNNCDDLVKICDSGCLEIESTASDIIKECAYQHNCNILINKNCVISKKSEILQCCREKCKTNDSIDCKDDICQKFIDNLTSHNISSEEIVSKTVDTHTNWMLISFIILVIILMLFLVFIQIEKIRKN